MSINPIYIVSKVVESIIAVIIFIPPSIMSFVFHARIKIFILIYKKLTSMYWLIVKKIKLIEIFIENLDVFSV